MQTFERQSGRFTRLAILAAVAGGGVYLYLGPVARFRLARAFPVEQLREYQELFEGQALGDGQPSDPPPRTGKVVVVRPSSHSVYSGGGGTDVLAWTQIAPGQRERIAREVDPPRLHDAWYSLSSSVRAASPAEVETVIFCDSRVSKLGHYVSKDPDQQAYAYSAYRREAVLKAFDLKTGRFLGACRVSGEGPPQETSILGRHSGGDPDVAAVIERMELR